MTRSDRSTPGATNTSGIRPGVWLFALASVLLLMVVICLPRPGKTDRPKQATQAISDRAAPDAVASGPKNAERAPRASGFVATKPMRQVRTLDDWVSDLESKDGKVVEAATQALTDLGPDAAPAIPRLAQMLKSGGPCNSAAYVLVNIGTNALPVLLDALTNGNKFARLDVAGAMAGFRETGAEVVPALIECLKYDDAGVRANAIASLQAIAKRPEMAVPALVGCLADPDPSVRGNATTVLEKYAKVEADTTLPILVQAARQQENPLVGFRVAEILRRIAPQHAAAEGL